MILIVKARSRAEALGYAKDHGVPVVFVRKHNGFDEVELACSRPFRRKVVEWFNEKDQVTEGGYGEYRYGSLLWFSVPRMPVWTGTE